MPIILKNFKNRPVIKISSLEPIFWMIKFGEIVKLLILNKTKS